MKIGHPSGLCAVPVRHAKASGFSLAELLITIVIVGILAATAVPSYREFVAGQRIKTASFDIMAVLTLARSEAIKRNASATAPVMLVPTGGAWANGWTVTEPGGTVLSRQSALPGVTITVTCTGVCPDEVAYWGNGRLTETDPAKAPSFEIGSASSTQMRCISIDLSGRPNVKVGGC
jgi:type IV fimbrial biogenesis protein FimT